MSGLKPWWMSVLALQFILLSAFFPFAGKSRSRYSRVSLRPSVLMSFSRFFFVIFVIFYFGFFFCTL